MKFQKITRNTHNPFVKQILCLSSFRILPNQNTICPASCVVHDTSTRRKRKSEVKGDRETIAKLLDLGNTSSDRSPSYEPLSNSMSRLFNSLWGPITLSSGRPVVRSLSIRSFYYFRGRSSAAVAASRRVNVKRSVVRMAPRLGTDSSIQQAAAGWRAIDTSSTPRNM